MMAQKLMSDNKDNPFNSRFFQPSDAMAAPQSQGFRNLMSRMEQKDKQGTNVFPALAIGSAFTPGSGISDLLGYAPDPFNPGQTLPSFSENIDKGKYLDAGLQTLGAGGDVALVAAPLTLGTSALISNLLKAPRKIKQIADLNDIDKSRRNFMIGLGASPLALKIDLVGDLMKNNPSITKNELSNKVKGFTELSTALTKGAIPDKKILDALIDRIESKLLDLGDDGLENSPNFEDLTLVLDDFKAIKQTDKFPNNYEYINSNAGDLYKEQIIDDVLSDTKLLSEDYNIDLSTYKK